MDMVQQAAPEHKKEVERYVEQGQQLKAEKEASKVQVNPATVYRTVDKWTEHEREEEKKKREADPPRRKKKFFKPVDIQVPDFQSLHKISASVMWKNAKRNENVSVKLESKRWILSKPRFPPAAQKEGRPYQAKTSISGGGGAGAKG